LPQERIRTALETAGGVFRNTLYNPAVTLWLSLSQCLDAAPSLAASVDRFAAWRAAQGLPTRSLDTSALAKARARLPVEMLKALTRASAKSAEKQADKTWHGHTVRVVDGTTLTLPDTPANQKKYPQLKAQKPGLGFPILRMVAMFSLTVGSVVQAVVSPIRGQGTGETTLAWSLLGSLSAGEVLVGDRLYGTYWILARLRQQGAHGVFRLHCQRKPGKGSRVHVWHKPVRPAWMSVKEYKQLPDTLTVRYTHVRVKKRGKRTKFLVLVTTLLDAKRYAEDSLALLYERRWQVEVYLRTLKQTMAMDPLVSLKPEMAEREVWLYLLAYNLVREVVAQAGRRCGKECWQMSFTRATSLLTKWLDKRDAVTAERWERMWQQLLQAVGKTRVGHRPNRVEPRRVKRRPKKFRLLTEPRRKARKRLNK
jgi:hypothetical protein